MCTHKVKTKKRKRKKVCYVAYKYFISKLGKFPLYIGRGEGHEKHCPISKVNIIMHL